MPGSHSSLTIWKQAVSIGKNIYRTTKRFPKEEQFGIISQLQRAGVSISSNIAEGSGRSSRKDFSRFIDIAVGSLNETESLLVIAKELEYIPELEYKSLQVELDSLGSSLALFKKKLK